MRRERSIWGMIWCFSLPVLLCGCGGRLGRDVTEPLGGEEPAGPRLVASFLVRANPESRRMHFIPMAGRVYGEGELRPDIYLKNDPSDPPDWDGKNKILAGSVALHSNRPRALYKVKILFKSSTLTGVEPSNPDGTTSAPYPMGYKYWDYGTVSGGSSRSARWELSVPDETPFDFVVEVWANEWREQAVSTANLYGIYAFDDKDIWVCGDSDTLLHTTDGGQSWTTYHTGQTPTPDFRAIWFPTSTRGFTVCHQRIFWSYTYPSDWRPILGVSGNITYNDVHFADGDHGWVVGYNDDIDKGEIRITSNGGSVWGGAINPDASYKKPLYGVWLLSSSSGWVVGGGGLILHSSNGGQNWSTQESGTTSALYDVHMLDVNDGWAVGAGGTILHWNGSQWEDKSPPGVTATLRAVWFVSTKEGWVVGDGGTILHTEDGGSTWESQESPVSANLHGLFFLNEAQGWAVGEGGVFLKF